MTPKPKSEQNWPNARTGFSLQGTWQREILALAFSQFCSDFGFGVFFVILLKNSSVHVALPDLDDGVYSDFFSAFCRGESCRG